MTNPSIFICGYDWVIIVSLFLHPSQSIRKYGEISLLDIVGMMLLTIIEGEVSARS